MNTLHTSAIDIHVVLSQGCGDHVVIFIKIPCIRQVRTGWDITRLLLDFKVRNAVMVFLGHSSFCVLSGPQWGCQIPEDLILAPAETPRSLQHLQRHPKAWKHFLSCI